jgi:hypothetical protein
VLTIKYKSIGAVKWKKSRASSASQAEKHMFGNSQDHDDEEGVIYFSTEPSVPCVADSVNNKKHFAQSLRKLLIDQSF